MRQSHDELVGHHQETQQMLRDFREELMTICRMSMEVRPDDRSLDQTGGRSLAPQLMSSLSFRNDRRAQLATINDAAISCSNGFLGHPVYHPGYCGPNCQCQCHKTPVSLARLVLNWLLGRSQPRIECNEPTCQHLQRTTFSVLRSFRQITAEVWIEGESLTHVYLRMPRVVKQEDFYWLQTATPNEVRRKLVSRELTVNDTESNGYSVLHVRQSLYNYQLGIHNRFVADCAVETVNRAIRHGSVNRRPSD